MELPSINETISQRGHSLFGCVRHMDQAALAHRALHLSVMTRLASGQFGTWRTTRFSVKMLGGAGHHEHRALSFWWLGVLQRIGQHGGRYEPSMVKHSEREFASPWSCRIYCYCGVFRVAGHPLAQNERCLHMFLLEPTVDKDYVPGKVRTTWMSSPLQWRDRLAHQPLHGGNIDRECEFYKL